MKSLLPKQPIFFSLLEDLCSSLTEMVELFQQFSNDFSNRKTYVIRASEIESQADAKAHEIIDALNKTFITPIDREDIYLLTHELDDIVDLIEDVIHNTDLYNITEKQPIIDEFATLIARSTVNICKLVGALQKQKYTEGLNGLVVAVHNLEDQGDTLFRDAIRRLFREEKDPIEVIRWKEILEDLEDILDKCQEVSNTIEGIVVKAS